MKKVYVVVVQPKISMVATVSQEGYSSVEEAIKFIMSRSDMPTRYDNWIFEGDNNLYIIKEIYIKE